MGAPGEAFFCKNRHLYHWIDDDLYWDEALVRQSQEAREKGCPCGAEFLLGVLHYGGLNDCICLNNEIPEKGVTPTGEVDEFPSTVKLAKYNIPGDVITGRVYQDSRGGLR